MQKIFYTVYGLIRFRLKVYIKQVLNINQFKIFSLLLYGMDNYFDGNLYSNFILVDSFFIWLFFLF